MNKSIIIVGAIVAGYMLASTLAQYPGFKTAYLTGAKIGGAA